jgi:putative membrane protein
MSERTFFLKDSKARVTATIRDVEAQTSAELVVAVKHTSGHYRDADFLGGFLLSVATLCALLFLPVPFAIGAMPIDVVVGFLLGSFFTSHLPPLRRLLLRRARMDAEVHAVARAAFVDRGISRTKGRNGIFVFVSTFERTVEVIADIGIDAQALGDPWRTATAVVRDSVSHLDFDRFVEALRSLGPTLGAAMPHTADDVNELPDEVEES